MDRRERMKAYITIVLSMTLGVICFAIAALFFRTAFAQELAPQPAAKEAPAAIWHGTEFWSGSGSDGDGENIRLEFAP